VDLQPRGCVCAAQPVGGALQVQVRQQTTDNRIVYAGCKVYREHGVQAIVCSVVCLLRKCVNKCVVCFNLQYCAVVYCKLQINTGHTWPPPQPAASARCVRHSLREPCSNKCCMSEQSLVAFDATHVQIAEGIIQPNLFKVHLINPYVFSQGLLHLNLDVPCKKNLRSQAPS